MPSQELETIVNVLRAQPRNDDLPIDERRAGYEQMTAMMPIPDDVRCEPVDAGGVRAEWIGIAGSTPPSTNGVASGATLLYLHGGGYVLGSINTHRRLVADIARASGARALAIDYRLAPEHPFPAAIEDATAAYRWLLAQGVAPERIVVAGDSAGGGLTASTLLALRDAGDPLPAAAVLISPWLDLTCTCDSMTTKAAADPIIEHDPLKRWGDAYLGGADARTPLASPLFAELAGLPPLLIHVGTAETLLDDSLRFAERALAAGVGVTLEAWDGMIHVWHAFAFMLPEGQQAIDRIGAYMRERVAVPA